MSALPLSILALAAGVYLLIKVSREYLGGLFKFFAWLVILLSLLSTAAVIHRGVHHFRMRHCGSCQNHEMREQVIIKELHGDGADSAGMMSCCKMQGDSMVLDRAMCEKMMGKEACDKMCKERGQCIMTKDECAKMCGGMSKCPMDTKACCKGGDKDMPACCKGEGKETPACCKGGGKETKACCKK